MNKIAFIIPGYYQTKKNNPAFSEIAGYFEDRNIKAIIVDVDWKYNTMTEYVEQFKKIYAKNKKGTKIYFLGFSLGAMISFISSVELKPDVQILCSLSPYFKEDLSIAKEWWKTFWGKKRIESFSKLSFNELSENNAVKTIILAGDKEGMQIHRRANDAFKKIKNCRLINVTEAKHQIEHENYLTEIKKVIYSL